MVHQGRALSVGVRSGPKPRGPSALLDQPRVLVGGQLALCCLRIAIRNGRRWVGESGGFVDRWQIVLRLCTRGILTVPSTQRSASNDHSEPGSAERSNPPSLSRRPRPLVSGGGGSWPERARLDSSQSQPRPRPWPESLSGTARAPNGLTAPAWAAFAAGDAFGSN